MPGQRSAALRGQVAAEKRNWPPALEAYTEAVNLFGETGSDAWTETLANCSIAERKRIDDNNREFILPLEAAQTLLAQARRAVPPASSSLRDRLDPIAEFGEIIQLLQPLTKRTSTLGQEIRDTLRDARESWRQAFLSTLKAAAADFTLSEALLSAACDRAWELRNEGCLYNQTEERLYWTLLGMQLDREYEALLMADGKDWAKIEENRDRRMGLTGGDIRAPQGPIGDCAPQSAGG